MSIANKSNSKIRSSSSFYQPSIDTQNSYSKMIRDSFSSDTDSERTKKAIFDSLEPTSRKTNQSAKNSKLKK